VSLAVSRPAATATSPIQRIVVIYMENHSFDEVLGALCVQDRRCNGVTAGKISTGATIPLQRGKDVVPQAGHSTRDQRVAINGGKMDRFDLVYACGAPTYSCYQQYQPNQIPNLARLAREFVIHDRLFSLHAVPTWGAHLELVAATLDGFTGDNPIDNTPGSGAGWGCDSRKDAPWRATPYMSPILVPSCVPKVNGTGPYRLSPVRYVPTIMTRMEAAGLSWKIYAGPKGNGYSYAICPTFAECIYGDQAKKMVDTDIFLTDVAAGRMPKLSLVMPKNRVSQHNKRSMIEGDNWIGSLVDAVMKSPAWPSTAIFITYDDCGCFYDHVPPRGDRGIRMPTVIISPYAKRGYTDSKTASFASLLAYIERTFNLAPLGSADANAYGFEQSFDYTQQPLAPVQMQMTEVPLESLLQIAADPGDPFDPT
jgi:phospholipase C